MQPISGSEAWALLDAEYTQQNGHKLRIEVPDTAVVCSGVLKTWLCTNKKHGVVQSVPRCQLSTAALLQKLKSQHPPYDATNPDGWVAVAHFSNGLSWLVDAAGLEQLLSKVYVWAVPEDAACCNAVSNTPACGSASGAGSAAAAEVPELQLLQAYIAPCRDERYVTTFGGAEGSVTTTQVRSYSKRYQGSASTSAAQAAALSALQQACSATDTSQAAAATTSCVQRASRQLGSCTGSIASLSAGFAAAEGATGANSATAVAAPTLCASVPAGDAGDARSSNGRGSCCSQVLSVEVGADGFEQLQLQCAASTVPQADGQDLACETPVLGPSAVSRPNRGRAADSCSTAAPDNPGSPTAPIDTCSTQQCLEAPGVCCTQAGITGGSCWQHDEACEEADSAHSVVQPTFGITSSSSKAAGHSSTFSSAAGGRSSSTDGGAVQDAPGRVSKAAAAAVQVLISYLDKALGLRVQGLVAEFIQPAAQADAGQLQLVLVGLPHLTLDPQQSPGRTTTFTERWGEFLAGAGPPPAPAPAQHTSYCRAGPPSSTHPTSAQAVQHLTGPMQGSPPGSPHHGRSTASAFSPLLEPFLQQAAASSSRAAACCVAGGSGNGGMHLSLPGGCLGVSTGGNCSPQALSCRVNRQFFPGLLPVRPQLDSAAGSRSSQGCMNKPGSPESMPKAAHRPLSAPRAATRAASPPHARPATASPCRMRPGGCSSSGSGTLPARPHTATSTRPGAGGNPVLRSSSGDSCRLWLHQPLKPSDSLTAQLAAQVEAAHEQLQHYAQAADAAALTAHCALLQATQQVSSVQQELLQLRDDAAAAGHERRQLQQELSALQRQRSHQDARMQAMQEQLMQVQEQLNQDRATLATMLRQHQEREQQLQEDLALAQQQNTELRAQSAQLSSRLDEESEVVSALRAQLVEYKLQMGQMQLQAKKGRTLNPNNSTNLFIRPGTATPPGQLGLGSVSGGFWGPQGGAGPAEGLMVGSSSGHPGQFARSGSFIMASGTADGAVAQLGNRLEQQQQQQRQQARNSPGARPLPVGAGTNECPVQGSTPVLNRKGTRVLHTGAADARQAQHAPATPAACNVGISNSQTSSAANNSGRSTEEQAMLSLAAAIPAADSNVGGPSAARLLDQALPHVDGPTTVPPTHIPLSQQQPQPSPAGRGVSAAVQCGASSHPHEQAANSVSTGAAGTSYAASSSCSSKGPGSNHSSSATGPGNQARPAGASSPEAVVAGMVSAIVAGLGGSLASASAVDPPLLIGDLLVGPMGMLDPSAATQLTVIAGLMREVYGDLMEVYNYYALLGSAQVQADRLTLELPQFGKLAYDLHLPQDNVTLSAVEDVFYQLSDRKPCQMLTAMERPVPNSSQDNPRSTKKRNLPSKLSSSGASGGNNHAKKVNASSAGDALAGAASAVHVVLPLELLVPEQFPEALVRLACVRYRYGPVDWEYNWDESESDSEDNSWLYRSAAGDPALSPRTARLIKQQQLQQQGQAKKGPKVLKPEGAALLGLGTPFAAAAMANCARSPSPARPMPEPYLLPTESDDLVTVVKTFLQHEVLKFGRRSKVAGSSLGTRRARDKPPAFQGWQELPAGRMV